MIRHIVAYDMKHGIAKHGVQPWYIPTDEAYFTEQTKRYGGVVVMGRKTFEVIGHPLQDRTNIVVTSQQDYSAHGVLVRNDLKAVLQEYPDIWVIGGGALYEATLAHAHELYVTEIDADFGCDVFYRKYSDSFRLKSEGARRKENGFTYRFNVYSKV